MKEVKILSIGWRSHWLAQKLNSLGIKVKLYEGTDLVQWNELEDLDGPFPLALNANSPGEFINLTKDNETIYPLEQGFCLSTPEGNLSWKSKQCEERIKILKKSFEEQFEEAQSFWLEDFLKSFSKTEFRKSSLWSVEQDEVKTNVNLYIRKSKQSTYEESLALLQEKGVELIKLNHQDLEQILESARKKPSQWILSLTIQELKLLTHQGVEQIGEVFSWHRKRFLYEGEGLESLPEWTAWIFSYTKPWYENNFYILIHDKGKKFLDIWSIENLYDDNMKSSCFEKAFNEAHDFLKSRFSYIKFEPKMVSVNKRLLSFYPLSFNKKIINDPDFIWNSPYEWGGFGIDKTYMFQKQLAQNIYSGNPRGVR